MSSPAPAYRPTDTAPVIAPDAFVDGLRKVAKDLRPTIPDLSDRETDFLYDLAREETRYPMPTVQKLCGLSRRSRSALAREAFADLIRAQSTPIDSDVGVTNAFDIELRSTGPADIAQRAFERDKNPITYARAKAALEHQLASTQLALFAVLRWGTKQGIESTPTRAVAERTSV